MKKTVLLAVCLVAVLVAAGLLYSRLGSRYESQVQPTEAASAAGQAENAAGESAASSAQTAPDFVFYDADNNAYRLSDFAGKPVVLNFWASWCSPCRQEMPDFEDAYQKYGDKVTFLMVNLTGNGSDTVASAKKAIADGGYSFPVYYDLDADGAIAYGISSIPTTLILDASGTLVKKQVGILHASLLTQLLVSLVAG